jgi:uncharacterized protein YndB with AHSA1/START domain
MPGETEPVRKEIRIAAPPEIVYAYFTDPARMVSWMGVAALLDPRPGGIFRVDVNGRDVVIGDYVELDPPRRLVFSWASEGPHSFVVPGSTRVEVTLERHGDGTVLTLVHHGLGKPTRDAHAAGWTHYLARLAPVASGYPAEPDPWILSD